MGKKTEKSDPETVPDQRKWIVTCISFYHPSYLAAVFFCEGKHRWKSAPKTDNLWWLFFGTQWSQLAKDTIKSSVKGFQPLVGKMIAMNFAPKLEKARLGKNFLFTIYPSSKAAFNTKILRGKFPHPESPAPAIPNSTSEAQGLGRV